MKKVVRTVWISLLSGLAFLSAGCNSIFHRRPECLYGPPEMLEKPVADTTDNEVQPIDKAARCAALHQQIDSLESVIKRRETACVYGSPEVMEQYREKTNAIRQELKELTDELHVLEMPKKERRAELQQRLDSLQSIIQEREMSCVYGSPEVMDRYRQRTAEIRQEAQNIEKEIEELDNE